MESYLTVSETAEYLNTSQRFVRWPIAKRRIAFYHVGRHARMAPSDVQTWLVTPRMEPHRAAQTDHARRRAS